MPEGEEKELQRFVNNLYFAIDVIMAATPGGGGGGPSLRAAMAVSPQAAAAAWNALPGKYQARLIGEVARQMGWSQRRAGESIGIYFSVSSQPGKTSSGQNGNNLSSGNNQTGSPFEGKDYNNLTPKRGWIKDSKEGLDKLSENESDSNIQST